MPLSFTRKQAPAPIARPEKAVATKQAPSGMQLPMSNCNIPQINQGIYGAVDGVQVEYLVDRTSYKDRPKPADLEIGAIRKRLEQPGSHVVADLNTLENDIKNGYTIMPGICEGGTKLDDWKGQQLFFLDFDNDEALMKRGCGVLDPLDALKRAYEEDLDPLFLYFTHSSSIDPYHPRYRLVFGLNELCTDRAKAEHTGRLLLKVFPEADPCSCLLNRMFYSPGREVTPCWRMNDSNKPL